MALNVGKEITALKRMTVPELRRKFAEALGHAAVLRCEDLPIRSHPDLRPDAPWSLFNAFTEVQKSRSPRIQMDSGLRLSSTFRSALAF